MHVLALFAGDLKDLRLVAISQDEEIISQFAEILLAAPSDSGTDAALQALDAGRRAALRSIVEGE